MDKIPIETGRALEALERILEKPSKYFGLIKIIIVIGGYASLFAYFKYANTTGYIRPFLITGIITIAFPILTLNIIISLHRKGL